MKLTHLLAEVDKEIETQMDEFHRLGKLAKKMIEEHIEPRAIHEIYLQMAAILNGLKPAEYILRDKYKHHQYMNKLFDHLLVMHEQNVSTLHKKLQPADDECSRGCCS